MRMLTPTARASGISRRRIIKGRRKGAVVKSAKSLSAGWERDTRDASFMLDCTSERTRRLARTLRCAVEVEDWPLHGLTCALQVARICLQGILRD